MIVGLVGLFDSPAGIDKARGCGSNLWGGAMLVFGLLMLLWQWLSPVRPPTTEEAREG
ncbi:hypothetical protein [Micromonospora sp. IBHARD004]|uniref:hypothetical protein n=1 Tax=Micromonospora sp. IBHARD004 TaxID=3457764 RepID=UPI004059E20F